MRVMVITTESIFLLFLSSLLAVFDRSAFGIKTGSLALLAFVLMGLGDTGPANLQHRIIKRTIAVRLVRDFLRHRYLSSLLF